MDDLLATLQSANPKAAPAPAPTQGAPASAATFDPTQSYGTPPKLLDNLLSTESSGNPYAVNKTTGAMGPYQFMPQTVAMLRKQGVAFDPFDPVQARNAADWYIQKLKAENGGTYAGAMKAYGGFVTKDATPYVSKVLAGVQDTGAAPTPTTPGQTNAGAAPAQAPDTGPMSDLLSTLQSAAKTPLAPSGAKTLPAAAAPAGTGAPAWAGVPASSMPTAPMRPATAAQTGSTLSDIAEKGVGGALTGTLGILGAGARLVGAENFANQVQNARQQVEAKIAADTNNSLAGKVAGVVGSALPYATLGGATIPGAMAGGAIAGAIPGIADNLSGAQTVRGAAQGAALGLGGALVGKGLGRLLGSAESGAAVTPAESAVSEAPSMQPRQVVGGGAASVQTNPYPVFSGEETSRGVFPQIKPSKVAGDVPIDEQALRHQVAQEITGGDVRTGVVSGNENTMRDEYAAANSPDQTNPANQAMRAQFAKEQQALSDYAEKRVEATGASPLLTNDEQRGNVINDAINGEGGFIDYMRAAKKQIYDQARQVSGDNPIARSVQVPGEEGAAPVLTTHVDALLSDPQFLAEAERSGNSNVVGGVSKLIALARESGFKDPVTGEVTAPDSVAAWDAVRKSNNAGWTPDTARTIGAINRAIDQDVAASAGSEAYKLGDALHQTEKAITDARGFDQIFGNADSNGVRETGIAAEKIPSKLNNMPMDQWRHIRTTLDNLANGRIAGAPEGMPPVSPELQAMAAAARNEMDGALAREVYTQGASKAGVWNQNSANKTLNGLVGQKILEAFPPDEVERFHTLNYGGQIMPGVHAYEGAAQQAKRLERPGFVEKYVPQAGASAGGAIGHVFGPLGSLVGSFAGGRAGTGVQKLLAARRGEKMAQAIQAELAAPAGSALRGLNKLRGSK